MSRVALFTKTFLEPTHYAIASVLARLTEHEFWVFAKVFAYEGHFALTNVTRTVHFDRGFPDELRGSGCGWVHAVFDGDLALRAVGAAKELGLPAVLSFHGGFDTKAKIRDPLYREITRQCAESAARVTVVSHADADRLRQIGVRRSIDVVRVPVDLSILPARSEPRAGHLVAIGRLVEKKGFDVALRALAKLPHDYFLTVVGDGPRRDAWTALARRLGVEDRVEWAGWQPLDRCLAILARALALVHPAVVAPDGNAEGTPQAVLWAQAMGVPVICGLSGDIGEIVRHRDTGLGVPAGNPEALASAVLALDSDALVGDLVRGGRAAANAHSLEAVLLEWRSIYADL